MISRLSYCLGLFRLYWVFCISIRDLIVFKFYEELHWDFGMDHAESIDFFW